MRTSGFLRLAAFFLALQCANLQLAQAEEPAVSELAAVVDELPPPDLRPWYVTRRIELALLVVVVVVGLAFDVFRAGGTRSLRTTLVRLRVVALLAAFGVVSLWALETHLRRVSRQVWERPLHVAVVLLSTEPIGSELEAAFRQGARRAMGFLKAERRRYQPEAELPCWLHVFGPVQVAREPPLPDGTGSLLERGWDRLKLERYFRALHDKLTIQPSHYDVRMYVVARPPRSNEGVRFVEGIGEAEGEIALVQVDLDFDMVDAAWTATLHELLHTVGAVDKYDGEGHALIPEGLVEPGQVPPFPQRYADLMVGEVPLALDRGRMPTHLGEVRIGPITAREIGWW